MIKTDFTTPLLDTSLHLPVVPHKSSRFIQIAETISNSLKNIHTLPTFSTAFLHGAKMERCMLICSGLV